MANMAATTIANLNRPTTQSMASQYSQTSLDPTSTEAKVYSTTVSVIERETTDILDTESAVKLFESTPSNQTAGVNKSPLPANTPSLLILPLPANTL